MDPVEGMFRNPDWTLVLLPGGLVLDADHFSALADAAQRGGDHTVAVTAYADRGRREPHFVVDWNRANFEELATETILGHVDVVAFGESASWGLFASPETFAVLGGSQDFMARFEGQAGGQAALERRFRTIAEDGVIGFGAAGQQYVDSLLEVVGWRHLQR